MTHDQVDTSVTPEGQADLRKEYETLVQLGNGLEKTTHWLDNEDEILARAPLLEREKIKVCLFCACSGTDLM